MFEELLRLINNLDGMQVTVANEALSDPDGYIDRECPAPDCMFRFKVFGEDWRNIVRDEEVFCPFCGHSADAKNWLTTDQVENVRQQAFAKVKGMMGEAIRCDATAFNRLQPRNGFITMSMNVSQAPQEIVIPVAAADPMRLKITCDVCSCRYAVVGSAFFCPSCGHNAADRVLRQSLATITAAMDALPLIRSSITDADVAENTSRLLVEGGLQNAVTAFQRYAEAVFSRQPNPPTLRRNVFQNLSEGSTAWKAAFGKGYDAYLEPAELNTLARFFQQRHLFAHKEGLVDGDYVKKSGDATYRPGQRLVLREEAVRRCVELVQKLTTGLAQDAP